MRGKRGRRCQEDSRARLIPAHAGKTLFHRRCGRARGAHPRSCGENLRVHRPPLLSRGSSPRMRGKHHRGITPSSGIRLIPAHAGKTAYSSSPSKQQWAHPRACGENRRPHAHRPRRPGSSPRMRGKQSHAVQVHLQKGLIPAHAGKTDLRRYRIDASAAHPRACGENIMFRTLPIREYGSSPRMRGKQ